MPAFIKMLYRIIKFIINHKDGKSENNNNREGDIYDDDDDD